MSGWGLGWFGGGAQKKKEAPKNAILQLRSTLEMLTKRERHLQNQMDEQDAMARKQVNTNKNAAKAALRRKKQFEHAMEQTSAQMMTIEREISSIETANINKETLDAMKNASAAMKKIHGGMTIDKVDQTMEDLREQHAISEEINDAITQPAMQANAMDEDDLDEELNELQQREVDDQLLEGGKVPVNDRVSSMPTPAKITPARQEEEEDEDKELERLQKEMAM